MALARALAPEPELLLLDEPLAQIDTILRAEMLDLLREVIRSREVTAVYVTHHWREAMELCQRIAVLDGGRIAMEGTLEGVFWNPPSPQLARLTGPVVELPRKWIDDGLITCAEEPTSAGPDVGEEPDLLVVRPQQVQLIEPAGPNRWQLAECRPEGAGWRLLLVHEGRRLSVASTAPMAPGQTVGVALKAARGASLPLRNECGKKED